LGQHPRNKLQEDNPLTDFNQEAEMDKMELIATALDYLHHLCDEFGHEIEEGDMEELETMMDKLESIQQGWFDADAE
jgi:hypothetical protein